MTEPSRRNEELPRDPRMEHAISELTERINARYPGTNFAVQQGIDDPQETWLVSTVDIDDPDEVVDLVIDRLLELQIDEQVLLHVLPIHTPERVAQTLSRRRPAPTSRGFGRYTHPSQP